MDYATAAARKAELEGAIATLKQDLEQCNGEAYRGCWMDSVKDRTGKRSYSRLRWFKPGEGGKKGCKTLRGEQVAEATAAIALWHDLERKEAELLEVSCHLADLRLLAARYGLEFPSAS